MFHGQFIQSISRQFRRQLHQVMSNVSVPSVGTAGSILYLITTAAIGILLISFKKN